MMMKSDDDCLDHIDVIALYIVDLLLDQWLNQKRKSNIIFWIKRNLLEAEAKGMF